MTQRLAIALSFAATTLLATALAGCGGLGSDDVPVRVNGPSPLTRAQVERQPEGSPARTVFEWWRALQFDNAAVAARYYGRSVEVTPEQLDRQLGLGIEALGVGRRPKLVETEEDGNRATVLLMFENVVRNPNGRVDKTRMGRGFNLVREQGEWKLADNTYLDRSARLVQSLKEETRRGQALPAQ